MHAMDDDELAALRWLHGRDRGRVETVYFRKDTKNEAPFAQPSDVEGKQAIGMAPGRGAGQRNSRKCGLSARSAQENKFADLIGPDYFHKHGLL
jgi:hypothetical protein